MLAPRIVFANTPTNPDVMIIGAGAAGLSAARSLIAQGKSVVITRNAAAVEVIVAEPKPGFLRAGADPRQPAYAIVR